MFGFENLSMATKIFILLIIVSIVVCNRNSKEGFRRKRRPYGYKRRKLIDAIKLMRLRRRWGRYLRRMRIARGYAPRCYTTRRCFAGLLPGNDGSVKSCKTKSCKGQNNKVCVPGTPGSNGKYWCCKKNKWVRSRNGACSLKPVNFCQDFVRCY